MVSIGFTVIWGVLVLLLQSFLLWTVMVALSVITVLAIMCSCHIVSAPMLCLWLLHHIIVMLEGSHANSITTMPWKQQEQFHNQPAMNE